MSTYILKTGCDAGYTLGGGTAVKLYCNSSKHWQYISGTAQCIAQ